MLLVLDFITEISDGEGVKSSLGKARNIIIIPSYNI